MSELITIDKKLDIFSLSALESLLQPLANEPDITIDLSQIERCDYIGIQLLVSFIKTVHKIGNTVTIKDPSIVVSEAIETLGLKEEFNIMDIHHG